MKYLLINIISDEELKELSEIFRKLDVDHSGEVTLVEFLNGMKSFGVEIKDTEIEEIFRKIMGNLASDLPREQLKINYSNFIEYAINIKSCIDEKELYRLFNEFDKDKSGFIDSKKIKDYAARQGNKLTEDEVRNIISQLDSTKDGLIDFQEFQEMFKHLLKNH